MRPVGNNPDLVRHPLDPAVGDAYGAACGPRRDYWSCVDSPSAELAQPHCHCDYHSGVHGCAWGNTEFIQRLTRGWYENHKHLQAREVAHALGPGENLNDLSADEFYAVPRIEIPWNTTLLLLSFVILPGRTTNDEDMHDSGYRKMEFVGIDEAFHIIGRFGASDNISFDGIGADKGSAPARWQIECLRGSGLLHVWNGNNRIDTGHVLSTFEPATRPKS